MRWNNVAVAAKAWLGDQKSRSEDERCGGVIRAGELETNRRDCAEDPGNGPAIGARGIKQRNVVKISHLNIDLSTRLRQRNALIPPPIAMKACNITTKEE